MLAPSCHASVPVRLSHSHPAVLGKHWGCQELLPWPEHISEQRGHACLTAWEPQSDQQALAQSTGNHHRQGSVMLRCCRDKAESLPEGFNSIIKVDTEVASHTDPE